MDKRGEVETAPLIELVNIVRYVIIFLILLSIFYGTYALFFKEKSSPQQLDWDRVVREISALPEGRSGNVITSSEGYTLFLYGGNNDEQLCAKKPCLCIEQPEKPRKCALLSGFQDNCANGLCARPSMFPESGILPKGTPVPICRQKNQITLGTC